MYTINTDILIVGGGIIGLACGKQLSDGGMKTILIEKSNILADGVSSRNSGVIHSGIYYKKNSLKARLCVDGKEKLYKYASKRNIDHKKVGKIIFGSSSQLKDIEKLYKAGIENGLTKLKILNKKMLNKAEPKIKADFGLLVEDTGVIDVTGYAWSLQNDIENNGSLISKNTDFKVINTDGSYFLTTATTGSEEFIIKSKVLIVACGLYSFEVAKKIEFFKNNKEIKKLNLTKGHYYKINSKYPFNHLIYPLPNKFSLGIHSSFDLSGNTRFGPDAEMISKISYTFSKGSKEKFIKSISSYWPEIKDRNLYEDYVGIRPKIQSKDGSFADFSILSKDDHNVKNFFFLQGIESPGLTSSLAIGEFIKNMIQE
jgi:L-2-hydroxyglutarate oxidase LhgO